MRFILAAGSGLILAGSIGAAAFAAEGGPRIQLDGVKSVQVTPGKGAGVQTASFSAAPVREVPRIEIGDELPLQYMMVHNPDRYDLPRPRDGWVYFEAENAIYRVDLYSREVLELMGRILR